ncbi:hypothetical protein GCM10009555_040880 [Acrocarpospora macrocephala]|uniref:Uncharacterized protein n=1 Tax=Acrocarpospora macrocephala TaxID=150177 RepID=A0A5M3WN55_9ACTN|nr:hypothetical protein Amac_035360 [Acrocarpospora macrocephala]
MSVVRPILRFGELSRSLALARGVRCRVIYLSIVLDFPQKLDEIRRMTGLRAFPRLSGHFAPSGGTRMLGLDPLSDAIFG